MRIAHTLGRRPGTVRMQLTRDAVVLETSFHSPTANDDSPGRYAIAATHLGWPPRTRSAEIVVPLEGEGPLVLDLR